MARLPFEFSGVKIIAARTTVEIGRSWWERLFSWPWHPWRALKIIDNPVLPPIGQAYWHADRNTYILHPQDYDQLKKVTDVVNRQSS